MQRLLTLLAIVLATPALASGDFVLPSVPFTATAVHETGAFKSTETIHYADGKLRIDPGKGFSSTILDFRTQSQCLLMVNHTYLVMPMDAELFRRYVAQPVEDTDARKVKTERIEGLEATKYAFGEDGALDAAGDYWLTQTGVMIKRVYEDGVYGRNVRHLEYLTHIRFEDQPAALFAVPAGFTPAK